MNAIEDEKCYGVGVIWHFFLQDVCYGLICIEYITIFLYKYLLVKALTIFFTTECDVVL
jgi:hypothetical protein